MIIGVISDTHGYLTDEAAAALRGSDAVIHAGDIGSVSVLGRLQGIAPLHAITGNCDLSDYGFGLKNWAKLVLGGVHFCVVHEPEGIRRVSKGADVIVYGHTHHARNEMMGDVLYFNPGSASRSYDDEGASVGRIVIEDGHVVGSEIVRV